MNSDHDAALKAAREDEERAVRTAKRGGSPYVPSIANPPAFPEYVEGQRMPMMRERRARACFRERMEASDQARLLGTSPSEIEKDIALMERHELSVPRVYRNCLRALQAIRQRKSYAKAGLTV